MLFFIIIIIVLFFVLVCRQQDVCHSINGIEALDLKKETCLQGRRQ